MSEYFYNFQFGAINHGYYYLKIDQRSLYSHTRFMQPDGKLYTNIFRLKLQDGRVAAYQYRDRPWVDFSRFPEDAYPGSAYPLWLNQSTHFPFSYPQVDESKDQVVGVAVVERIGDSLSEMVDGTIRRKFLLAGNKICEIDWGGPISNLCGNADEAVSGSMVTFHQ